MVVITAENYTNAKVRTITAKSKELFSVKSISDLLTKDMQDKFETKKLTEEQKIYIKELNMK